MALERSHLVFKTVDNPLRILFWELDEFLCIAAPLFLGMCFSSFLLMCSGIVAKPLYTRLKKKCPNQHFKHMVYWYLPTRQLKKMGIVKNLPPSHVRAYLL